MPIPQKLRFWFWFHFWWPLSHHITWPISELKIKHLGYHRCEYCTWAAKTRESHPWCMEELRQRRHRERRGVKTRRST